MAALAQLKRANRRYLYARSGLTSAIHEAATAGIPPREIANTLGLSLGFVRQILLKRNTI